MEESRFDTWTRRRFGLATGGAAVALMGLAGRNGALAKKKKKKKCKGGKKKCGKKCILKTQCCVDTDCPTGADCVSGTCVCPSGTTNCGDVCADLTTDGANCGACGNVCDTNGCVNGFCTCQVPQDCNGCVCALRLEDAETACTGDITTQTCSVDADCPTRSFCRDAIGGFCSEPCPA
jgi:hypothetical protein